MRKIYFIVFILFLLVGGILVLQNAASDGCMYQVFLEEKMSISLFVPALMMFVLGIATGFFGALWITAKKTSNENEVDQFEI